ncbi:MULTISPECIES: DUF1007 family protein [unclassified Pseudodesulfovibrio]|uniref:HoxN/HupN/NixA family nickel/cobalt transporter n=1 Tax=unclassified Pseudodesulfovibrio TaxID=2661612 RepID=UPI000FEBF829|nr:MULTISPECIES: DUF1007 family protein [unclassified Pseudodesulfovibrio]MCJ2165658.1 DUF1007 family protein [Pseudodesulfovibrio sp. S3-i]RWU02924.1 DUF1007 family protein [Pseudodesulfovibrio sp. S3]
MRTSLVTLSLLVTLCLALLPVPASAHPHVFVDVSLLFRLDDTGLTGVHQNWLFDEIFTQAILGELELDAATLNSPEAQETIRTGAFEYLANYGYFTLIETGGRRIPVTEARGFKASLAGDRLVYDFDVPLNLPLAEIQGFRMAVFDKEYYSDVVYAEGGISFEVNGLIQVSHSIQPAKDHTYWQYIVPNAVHLSVSASSDTAPQAVSLQTVEAPGLMTRAMDMVRSTQKQLTQRLNGFGMKLKDDPFGPALWMFLGLAFIYGVVHAVGPGHGKAVVCSYFLSNPGSFFHGALMGNAITFVHMGSAAVAVGIAYLVFSTGMGGFAAASRALQPASYALLALMGLFLLIKAVRDVLKGGMLADPSCDHQLDQDGSGNVKSILAVSFVTGLIPCPGAAVILAFSIGLNIFWIGLLALVVMAAGMGLTTTLFAWAAVSTRSATLTLSGRNRKVFNVMYAALSVCGAGAIGLFGTALFISSLTS